MKIISAKQRSDRMAIAYFNNHGTSALMCKIIVALDEAEKNERQFAEIKNEGPLNGFEQAYLNTLGYRINSSPIYNGNIGPSGKFDHYINW